MGCKCIQKNPYVLIICRIFSWIHVILFCFLCIAVSIALRCTDVLEKSFPKIRSDKDFRITFLVNRVHGASNEPARMVVDVYKWQ